MVADVRRGIWRPRAGSGGRRPSMPTFHEFASEWFEQRRGELRQSTSRRSVAADYVLLPFFQHHRLDAITPQEVDRYRHAQVRERDRCRRCESVASRSRSGRCRTPRSTARSGCSRRSSKWPWSTASTANPATGRRRRLKPDRPERAYLDSAGRSPRCSTPPGRSTPRPGRPQARRPRAVLATLVRGPPDRGAHDLPLGRRGPRQRGSASRGRRPTPESAK